MSNYYSYVCKKCKFEAEIKCICPKCGIELEPSKKIEDTNNPSISQEEQEME